MKKLTKLFKIIAEYIHTKRRLKKIAGIFLIFIGFISLITPLTPGAWLALIGLELLGVRIVFFDKFKFWKKKQEGEKDV